MVVTQANTGGQSRRTWWQAGAFVAVALVLFMSIASGSAQIIENKPKVVGGPGVLWVYGPRPAEGGERVLWFGFRVAEGPRADRYFRLPIPGLTGEIRAAGVRGDYLHAVFSDGSHWRFAPTTPGWHTVSPAVRFAEVNLPGSVTPVAICGDLSGEQLFALTPPDGEAAEAEVPRWAVLRYAGGEWTKDRDGPGETPGSVTDAALAARDATVHLFYRAEGSDGRLTHRTSESQEDEWSAPRTPFGEDSIGVWTAGWVDGQLTVFGALARASASVGELRVLDDDSWQDGISLRDADGGIAEVPADASLALYGQRAVMATGDANGAVVIGAWSALDGAPIEPSVPVSSLNIALGPEAVRSTRQMLQYVILAGVLLLVFLRRREGILLLAPLPVPLIHARLARRLMAILVDLVFTSPIWLVFLFLMVRTGADGLSFSEQIALGPQGVPDIMFWSWAVVGMVMAVYCFFCELMMRATPGKKLAGCWVLGEDGAACGLRAVFVRNIMRIVEFHFLPLAILVIMTPNRQRLGDLLGRTVVVEAGVPLPTESTEGGRGREEDDASE